MFVNQNPIQTNGILFGYQRSLWKYFLFKGVWIGFVAKLGFVFKESND